MRWSDECHVLPDQSCVLSYQLITYLCFLSLLLSVLSLSAKTSDLLVTYLIYFATVWKLGIQHVYKRGTFLFNSLVSSTPLVSKPIQLSE